MSESIQGFAFFLWFLLFFAGSLAAWLWTRKGPFK